MESEQGIEDTNGQEGKGQGDDGEHKDARATEDGTARMKTTPGLARKRPGNTWAQMPCAMLKMPPCLRSTGRTPERSHVSPRELVSLQLIKACWGLARLTGILFYFFIK